MRGVAILDLIDLNGNVKEKSIQIKSVWKMLEFNILRQNKNPNKITNIRILHFKRPASTNIKN